MIKLIKVYVPTERQPRLVNLNHVVSAGHDPEKGWFLELTTSTLFLDTPEGVRIAASLEAIAARSKSLIR